MVKKFVFWDDSTFEVGVAEDPKTRFWSAIITQTQGSVTVTGAGGTAYVDIQPPSGETWLVDISGGMNSRGAGSIVYYGDYDGTTLRYHTLHHTSGNYGDDYPHLELRRVLTNSLYARFYAVNQETVNKTLYYGYSGFKLSRPLWSPKRLHNPEPKPWKREKTKPLPAGLEALDKYAFDILGINPEKPNEYELAVILEEDTPLAVDPATNFPVERLTAVISAENLVNILNQRDDPSLRPDIVLETPPKYRGRKMRELKPSEFEYVTGYKKYFDRWRKEGIKI